MSPATFMALAVAVCLIFAGSAALIVHFALRANTHAADGNQDDNSSAAAVSNDRRDKSASGERSGSAKSTLLAQTEIDKAWKQIQPFVVTLSIATPDGERSGTGLLIDTRGWIATTYHLVRDAEQIDVRFAPDAELAASDSPHLVRCTGTVASLPEYDLAIVAVDMSSVASFVEPALNTKDPLNADDVVLACRQPDRSGSWLAACRVHDLIPNEKLPPTSKSILRERGLHDNDELIWIEHETPISAESSGSPLLNARGEVVGLNTQLSPTSKHGYAIPIQHLVQLKESATGAITPFKPPALVSTNKVETPEVSPPIPATEPAATPASDPTPDRDPLNYVKYIRAVHQECKAFDFSPSTAAQYEQLQRLARCVNTAKEFEEKERVDEGMRILVGETAQEVLNELSETPWPIDATLAEANNFAADAMNVPGNAVFAYLQITVHPRVSAPLDGQPTFIAQLVGTDQTVVLPTRLNPSDLKKGSRWLVLGMHDESIRLQIGVGDEIDERVVPLIRAKYLIGEPQATDAPDRR